VIPLKPGTPGAPSLSARERAHAFLERFCINRPSYLDALAAEFEAAAEASPCAMCAVRQEREAAAYARGRREALEEAAKAQCTRCRFGAGFEPVPEDAIAAIIPTYHTPKTTGELYEQLSAGWCDAVPVRALLSALARKEGK
jgi:hypothetical protein